jgi:hypothetical protein
MVGGLFAGAPTLLGPHPVGGQVTGGGVEPGRQDYVDWQFWRLAGQRGEHLLRDVRRTVRIATEAPPGGGVDQIEVSRYQLVKSGFVPSGDKTPETLAVA